MSGGSKYILLFLIFLHLSYGEVLHIISNYPLPKNNLQEIYKKTKDIDLILNLLKKTEDFESIEYKDGKIYLKRKPVIKKIYVYGNRSFWKREILAVSGLLEGYSFEEESIYRIVTRLKQFYLDKGYPWASVYMNVDIDSTGDAIVYLKIKEGKRAKVKNIHIFSDIPLDKHLKEKVIKTLGYEKGDDFSFEKLQEKIEKTSNFLQRSGYYDNFLSFYSLKKEKGSYVTVNLFLSLGFHYEIRFEGNRHIPSKKLKKLLTFEEGVNFYQINKSVEKIISYYKNRGFLDVKVYPAYREDFYKNRYEIVFKIEEGDLYRISDIDLHTDIPSIKKIILSLKGKPYNKSRLEKILKDLFFRYYKKGYLSFKFSINESIDRKNKTVSLVIKVFKNKKFILEGLTIKGAEYTVNIDIPRIYNPEEILLLLEKIKQHFLDKGYLDVQVFLNVNFKSGKDITKVFLTINIQKNIRYRQGITFIYGTWHLSPKVIEWNLSKDRYFSKYSFDAELDYLYSLYLFDTINPYVDIDKKKKKVNKDYILKEDKRGLFQGSIGYSSEQKFKIALQGTLRNLFEYGFEIYGYIETSDLGQTYQLSFLNKFVPFRNTVSLSLFRNIQIHRIFDLVERGYKISLNKKKDKYRTYNISFEYKDNSIKKMEFFSEKNFLSYKLSYLYKDLHGEPKLNPKEGYNFRYGFYIDFGDFSVQKLIASYRKFFTWKFITFAPKLSAGYIFQKLNKIPPSERFFLGGVSNLRGFSYEEVAGKYGKGGKSFLVFNGEIRFPLYKPFNLYGLAFYDTGNVYENFSQLKDLYLRDSLGTGIYIPTPVGSFMLYAAYNINRKENENRYRIEFSIATEF